MSIVSLSTMWAVERFQELGAFWARAREMGFAGIELNWQIPPPMLEGLERIEGLRVSSVHSPCPAQQFPDGRWASQMHLSSRDEEERRLAVFLAKESIALAARVGACAVVLHLGSVPLARLPEQGLRRLYQEVGRDGAEFRELQERLRALRQEGAAPHLEAALRSARELAHYAREQGVVLGLETRYYFYEIPNLEEMQLMLGELGEAAGYWHDVGHAENQERLGFTRHREWLERLGDSMIGCHLHDIQGLLDHRAAGLGDMDWGLIAAHLPQGALRVCEFANGNGEEEVRQGLAFLRKRGMLGPED